MSRTNDYSKFIQFIGSKAKDKAGSGTDSITNYTMTLGVAWGLHFLLSRATAEDLAELVGYWDRDELPGFPDFKGGPDSQRAWSLLNRLTAWTDIAEIAQDQLNEYLEKERDRIHAAGEVSMIDERLSQLFPARAKGRRDITTWTKLDGEAVPDGEVKH